MPAYRNLANGDVAYIQGSAAQPYQIKNVNGAYSCSCPAWRNQREHPDHRTCKHIKALRGVAPQQARLGQASPAVAAPVAASPAARRVARVSAAAHGRLPTAPVAEAFPVASGLLGHDLPCLLAEKWTPDIERPSWEL